MTCSLLNREVTLEIISICRGDNFSDTSPPTHESSQSSFCRCLRNKPFELSLSEYHCILLLMLREIQREHTQSIPRQLSICSTRLCLANLPFYFTFSSVWVFCPCSHHHINTSRCCNLISKVFQNRTNFISNWLIWVANGVQKKKFALSKKYNMTSDRKLLFVEEAYFYYYFKILFVRKWKIELKVLSN